METISTVLSDSISAEILRRIQAAESIDSPQLIVSNAQAEMLSDVKWDEYGQEWVLSNPSPKNTREALVRKKFIECVWRPVVIGANPCSRLVVFLTPKGRNWLINHLLSRVNSLENQCYEQQLYGMR